LDIDLCEFIATTVKLDLTQRWEDAYVSDLPTVADIGSNAEVAKIVSATPLLKDNIDEIIASKPNSFRGHHKPRKGSELSSEELDEFKNSIDKLIVEPDERI
jgi:hypothetical protein